MGRIAVVGSANADLVVRVPRRPEPGETIVGSDFRVGAGGKGLNQAVAAARAGGDVSLVAAIGDDAFGTLLRSAIAVEQIDARCVRTTRDATGIAHITVTEDGENSIVVVAGANEDAQLTDDDIAVLDRATHVMLQLERPISLVRRVLTHARERGVSAVLTPAPIRDDVVPLLGLCDIVVANEAEAAALTGEGDARASAVHVSRLARVAIITRGSRGCVVAVDGGFDHEHAAPRVQAVDTTGAGDTFAGYLTAGLAAGRGLGAAVALATDAAALSVTRPGAVDSIPRAVEVAAFSRT